jgi:hypothetical protein
MFVQFLIVVLMIGTVGPGHIEGGFKAVEEKGFKAAAKEAIVQAKPVDYSKLNN